MHDAKMSSAAVTFVVLLLVVTGRYAAALHYDTTANDLEESELEDNGEATVTRYLAAMAPGFDANLSETRGRRSTTQQRRRAASNREQRRNCCRRKTQLPCAAQFIVDERKYNNVPEDTLVNITRWWRPDALNSCDEWFRFNSDGGYLTIHKDGLYFLHAQMTYNNSKPDSGFSIVSQSTRDSSQQLQQLAKCVTKNRNTNHVTTATCYTAKLAHLRRNQLVFINNTNKYHRPIITSPQSSFWGIYKIN